MKEQEINVEYIRSELQPGAKRQFDGKLNGFARNGTAEYPFFSNFPLPYFPFWNAQPFYQECLPQQQTYPFPKPSEIESHHSEQVPKKKKSFEPTAPQSKEQPIAIKSKARKAELSYFDELELEMRQESEQQPKKRRKKRGFNSFSWTIEENKRYFKFVKQSHQLFELPIFQKKNLKVNVLMSCKVRSRSAQQCHSHHQKLVKKYGSIEALLLEFEKDMLNARKKEGKEYIPRKLPVTNAQKSNELNVETALKVEQII